MTVLQKVPNGKGKVYEIRMGDDGNTYCTCAGWRFSKESPKMCKHLRAYLENQQFDDMAEASAKRNAPVIQSIKVRNLDALIEQVASQLRSA